MDQAWNAARLIPTSGIDGDDEQERRATSVLLAVLSTVRRFGRALLTPLGAPAGTLETFFEVPFELAGRRLHVGGLVRVRHGRRSWTALVEVRTGANDLRPERLQACLDVAREHGFDAVLTISNQLPTARGHHPTIVDRRTLRSVALHHLPWLDVVAEAVRVERSHRDAAPDQAWILGELVRYLGHPSAGTLTFHDMGNAWGPVRHAVLAGTLQAGDPGIEDVAAAFEALLRYVDLRHPGPAQAQWQPARAEPVDPEPARPEPAGPELLGLRRDALRHNGFRLSTDGVLTGALRAPGAAATVTLTADLRASQLRCACTLDAPRHGRPRARVVWLLRQLAQAPDTLHLEASPAAAAEQHRTPWPGTADLLGAVRVDPARLAAPDQELRSFRLTQVSALGAGRGNGTGSFISSVVEAVDTFHEGVVRHLRTTVAPPRAKDPVTAAPGAGGGVPAAGRAAQARVIVLPADDGTSWSCLAPAADVVRPLPSTAR